VMIDASMHEFKENVRLTKEVVGYAHARNVDVEAEIGHVGGTTESPTEMESVANVYTTVEEATAFIEQTGADSLAVSIGTSHGVYKNNKNPELNFQRLQELAAQVPVPLVLHGGSGTGDDNLKRCVREGITKVNVFTEFTTAALAHAAKAVREEQLKSYMRVQQAADEGIKSVISHYNQLLTK
ncbi:MAG: class II fructose-bisphosphate aldolase, partial [Selenomonadaceae bacterium]|nr:class II fructose-bisphosphate aldolase [Selenomonadaceae bacterium]